MWLANKSPQRLLVVLTGGEFAWAEDTGHGDEALVALPPALRGAFVEEPRWVDLRWLRDVGQVDQSNPRLRECVADVAAAVREVEKDELVGEHISQHRRTMRLARGGVTTLAVLLIVALVAAGVAFQQRATAQSERDTAIFNRVTAQADRLRSTDMSLAAQLDLTAYRMQPTPDLRTSLVTMGNGALSTPLTGHTTTVNAVAFSPDGHTLVTGSLDQSTVRRWNITDPTHLTPRGPALTERTNNNVRTVAFSPDGQTLAIGNNDRTVQLWNITDPTQLTPLGIPLTGHTDAIDVVAFSPDGHTLVTGSADTTVRLWNVTDPAHPTPLGPPLPGHTGAVRSVTFSPDGHILATGSTDTTVRLWNVTDLARPTPLGPPLTGHTNTVNVVGFSPDGRTLATGSEDRTARLWNIPSAAHHRPHRHGHHSGVQPQWAHPGHRQLRPDRAVVECDRPGSPHTPGHTPDRPHQLDLLGGVQP